MYEGKLFTRLAHLYKGDREVAKTNDEDELEGKFIINCVTTLNVHEILLWELDVTALVIGT